MVNLYGLEMRFRAIEEQHRKRIESKYKFF